MPTAILLCFDIQRLNIFFLRHHLQFDPVSIVEKKMFTSFSGNFGQQQNKDELVWVFFLLCCKIIQFVVPCVKYYEIDEHYLQMISTKFLMKTQTLK